MIEIYTDGACLGNPGPGGWGYVQMGKMWASGFQADTTNNQMEMQAVIEALQASKGPVRICTDSEYIVKGWNQWLAGWQERGWQTAAGKPVKNRDRWEKIAAAAKGREIAIVWVRAHKGIPGNETADRLAEEAAMKRESRKGSDNPFPGWDPSKAERRKPKYSPGPGPATEKQKSYAASLAKKKGTEMDTETLDAMSKAEISALIDELRN